MKIVVITGSPHKQGTSALLADKLIEGAKEAGHEIYRFDAAFSNVHGCIACETCHTTKKGCVFKDSMETLNPYLLEADAVIFVSPTYYFGMSSQIRAVIDRFYANNSVLKVSKKSALLMTCADDTKEAAAGAVKSFEIMTDYLGWKNVGVIVAYGCGVREDIEKTSFPEKAFELGKAL
ncbi:MAG: flavodoxin family protein [Lachnospiraceae bacterium]